MAISIQDHEITFVIQGPIQASKERSQLEGVTAKNIRGIRQHFPASPIILSTWKGQDTSGLDVDQLLLLDDPGQNTIYNNGVAQKLNNNRQLFGCAQGLRQVTTKYAVKVRSDNIIAGRGFVELYQQLADIPRQPQQRQLKQRVLTSSAFFISSHYGRPVYFHKSDLFDFGLTEDLQKIWPETLLPELYFDTRPHGFKIRPPATEQFFVLHWLSLLMGKKLEINNKVLEHAGLGSSFWPEFIAANLIVASPEELGLDVTKRFYQRGNIALEYDLKDWKHLAGLAAKPLDGKRAYRCYRYFSGKLLSNLLR